MDARTRKERRIDPERWLQVISYFDDDKQRVIECQGVPLYVRGNMEGVVVVQVPNVDRSMQVEVLKAVKTTLEGAGISTEVAIIPSAVRFMKFQPVDAVTSKQLDKKAKMSSVKVGINQKKLPNEPEPTKH
jgi:hypothetical protein